MDSSNKLRRSAWWGCMTHMHDDRIPWMPFPNIYCRRSSIHIPQRLHNGRFWACFLSITEPGLSQWEKTLVTSSLIGWVLAQPYIENRLWWCFIYGTPEQLVMLYFSVSTSMMAYSTHLGIAVWPMATFQKLFSWRKFLLSFFNLNFTDNEPVHRHLHSAISTVVKRNWSHTEWYLIFSHLLSHCGLVMPYAIKNNLPLLQISSSVQKITGINFSEI